MLWAVAAATCSLGTIRRSTGIDTAFLSPSASPPARAIAPITAIEGSPRYASRATTPIDSAWTSGARHRMARRFIRSASTPPIARVASLPIMCRTVMRPACVADPVR